MKKLLFVVALCSFYSTLFSQMNNIGSTIYIESGATLTLAGGGVHKNSGTLTNSGQLLVKGSLTNTGTITTPGSLSKVIFIGSWNADFIVGNSSIGVLEIRKTSSNLKIFDDLTIDDELIFNSTGNSMLELKDSDLILLEAATITGSTSQNYVMTTGAGFLIKEMDAAENFNFPVGNSAGRTELQADVTGTSFTNARLKVRVENKEEPNVPNGASNYLERHWILEAENIANYQNQVEGSYLPGDVVGQELLIKGASHNGTDWSYVGAARATTSVLGTITSLNSTFTGLEQSAPLPVELLTFDAKKLAPTSAELTWSTASEKNTSHYSIERSLDAIHWKSIGRVDARGESSSILDYKFIDESISQDVLASGILYYRLHILDFDGYSDYSTMDAVSFSREVSTLNVYPNPTSGLLNLITSGENSDVTIYNSLGKLVMMAANTKQVNLQTLPEGVYRVAVQTGEIVQFSTVVKND